MTDKDGEGAFYYTIASKDDMDGKFPAFLATHPDFLKVYLVYSEDFAARKNDEKFFSRKGLDPALVSYLVSKAHAAHLRVAAHVESAQDFDVAVKAGVDNVAHMPGFWPDDASIASGDFRRYQITEKMAEQAEKQDITVTTTLGESLGYSDTPQFSKIRSALLDL